MCRPSCTGHGPRYFRPLRLGLTSAPRRARRSSTRSWSTTWRASRLLSSFQSMDMFVGLGFVQVSKAGKRGGSAQTEGPSRALPDGKELDSPTAPAAFPLYQAEEEQGL